MLHENGFLMFTNLKYVSRLFHQNYFGAEKFLIAKVGVSNDISSIYFVMRPIIPKRLLNVMDGVE